MHFILMCYALLTIGPLICCNRISSRAKTLSESAKSWQLINIIYGIFMDLQSLIFNLKRQMQYFFLAYRTLLFTKKKHYTNNSVKFWILWERNNFFNDFFWLFSFTDFGGWNETTPSFSKQSVFCSVNCVNSILTKREYSKIY